MDSEKCERVFPEKLLQNRRLQLRDLTGYFTPGKEEYAAIQNPEFNALAQR